MGSGVLALWGQWLSGIAPWLPETLGARARGTLLPLAFAAAYVISYPAVEIESPTLNTIDLAVKAGAIGLSSPFWLLR